MKKIYRHLVKVETDNEGIPVTFFWHLKTYNVTRCEVKKAPALPFESSLDEPDRYMCQTEQGIICELVKKGEEWILERVWGKDKELTGI